MTDARARLDSDEELAEWFEGREEKSATVRDALRLLMAREAGGESDGLNDDQAAAYGWLTEHVGVGARVSLDYAENRIAQLLSLDMGQVRRRVVKPLDREGYISVVARIRSVKVVVRPLGGGSAESERAADAEPSVSAEEAEVLAEARERLESAESARTDGGDQGE